MIITIANSKGGSGKSTICLNLAIRFALENKDVIIIDTDEQRSVGKFSDIRESRKSNLLKQIALLKKDPLVNLEKELKLEELQRKLSNMKADFTCISKTGDSIVDTIKKMASKFEVIILDTKATVSKEQRKSILLSDYLIIPTTTSQIDLAELLELFDYVEELKIVNESLKVFIVLNRINPNPFLTNEARELKEFISNYQKEKNMKNYILMDSILHDRIDYKRSIVEGLGVSEMKSKASKEFNDFYMELKNGIEGVDENIEGEANEIYQY